MHAQKGGEVCLDVAYEIASKGHKYPTKTKEAYKNELHENTPIIVNSALSVSCE